ncbi:MAG: four helix bundle protein [Bacteroidota bacterium]
MALVTQFEDLECWKLSRLYVKKIYLNTSREQLNNDFGFQSQIRDAAVSIMNNIAEGFGRLSKKEFKRFLDIALGSLAEIKSMTYIAFDLAYFSEDLTEELQIENEIIKSKILGLIKYLNTKI